MRIRIHSFVIMMKMMITMIKMKMKFMIMMT